MIANCGAMGLDWRTLDMSDYMEAVEAHGDQGEAKSEPKVDPEIVKRAMKWRRGGNSGVAAGIGSANA